MWRAFPRLTPVILALRNMRIRWMRTALTGLGIVLGVAVILAIAVTNDSTLLSIRGVFDEASGQANLVVLPSAGGGEGFDAAALNRVAGTAGVVTAAPAVQASTLLARDAQNWTISFGIGGQATAGNHLQLLGVDPALDPLVRQYTLTAGRWLVGEAYEAVITEPYAAEKALRLGDDLVLIVPGGQERLRIVGLVARDGAGLLNDGQVAFVPLPVVQDLFGRGENLDEVDVVATPEIANTPAQLEALKGQLADRLGRGYEVAYPAARGQLVTQMLSTYQQGLSFFSVIALFVGAFLIYNAFSMTILERTRELGLLRALGMTRGQVLELVLTEAVVLGALGSLVGVGFGLVLARGLIGLMGAVAATDITTLSVPAAGLAQSLLVGGLVTLGSALIPALQGARTSPLEALRVKGEAAARPRPTGAWAGLALLFIAWAMLYEIPWRPEVGYTTGSLAILLLMLGATLLVPHVVGTAEWLARPVALLIFGNEGLLGSGNVRRATGRTALTVAALLVGIAMVISTASLAQAFTHDLTAWVETALGGDLYVRAPMPLREQFGRQLAAVPGVAGITKIRYFTVRVAAADIPPDSLAEADLVFAAIDPTTYRAVGEFEFAANQGDPDANWARFSQGDALFISTVVADRFQVQQGDTLRLVTRRGEHDFYVAAVAVDFTGQGFIVSGSWNDMRRWFAQSGVDRFTLAVAPGYTPAQVQAEIETRYKTSRNLSVETTEEFKAKVLALADESFKLFNVLGLIGIVVAALGVVNTLMMNVLERQREIGSLRSLGLTRRQTTKMVLAEAATLGVIGGVLGLGFGYLLSQIFIMALNALSGYDLAYIFTPNPFFAGAAIALLVSQVAALYPAWKAAGVNIVEAVKHE